jgi:nucleotide-binding universal stress UspA family protein
MFEKILVCLDGSELAEQILPYATEEAIHCGSRLVLLRVITGSSSMPMAAAGVPAYTTEAVTQQMESEEQETKAYLERLAQPLQQKGLRVECVTLHGLQIGEAIVSYADKNDIGLIAIATHGRSGLGRLVFGSVADFVLRESGLPILLVKPKKSGT